MGLKAEEKESAASRVEKRLFRIGLHTIEITLHDRPRVLELRKEILDIVRDLEAKAKVGAE